jgi:hypothetical protein
MQSRSTQLQIAEWVRMLLMHLHRRGLWELESVDEMEWGVISRKARILLEVGIPILPMAGLGSVLPPAFQVVRLTVQSPD